MGCFIAQVRVALLVSILVVPSVAAQQRIPAFEVASVKPNTSDNDNSMRNLGAGGRMVFVNYSLLELISAAWDIQPFQLIGVSPWLRTERFDITARASTTASLPEMNLMLRSLLVERFKLKVHQERRELPVYFLVKAHNDGRLGPGLKPSAVDCGPGGRGRGPAPGGGPPAGCRALITPAGVDFEGQSMSQLATVLGMNLRQTVVDQTALSGGYNLKLSFAPMALGATDAAPADPNLPSLFSALEDQLGLKLERRDGPTDVLVIDAVERPTPD